MIKSYISVLSVCLFLLISFSFGFAQDDETSAYKSQEVSEKDGIPVLIKHLPDWENKQKSAVLVNNSDDLRKALGDRPVFQAVEFIQEMEAVTATYPQGKLLIIEYNTPQASVAADNKIKAKLNASDEKIFYRRIGNYNVLLLDGTDEAAANALFDQIKYEKVVQWLGQDVTFYQQQEQNFIQGTMSLFISTVMVIGTGLGIALFFGIIAGLLYFRMGEQRRAAMDEFSDAGGMTRLNLDGLTPEILPARLLEK